MSSVQSVEPGIPEFDDGTCVCGEKIGNGGDICRHGGCRSMFEYYHANRAEAQTIQKVKTSTSLDWELWDIVGKTILSVDIANDRESVVFATDDGPIRFQTVGDCCSQSWIEEFDHEGIVGSTVTKIEEIEVPPSPDDLMETKYPENQQEYDKAYFFKLTTTSGGFTIEMRNSSNGYYGGWLEEERA